MIYVKKKNMVQYSRDYVNTPTESS